MIDREKVIRGFECCVRDVRGKAIRPCDDCPYDNDGIENPCQMGLMTDALALLKDQEPRVLTLEELRDVGQVWESSAPPYLWLDKNRSIYNTISFWCAWRDIYEMIHGRHDKYTDENYGSEWRCWTARPTEEQMRDTKWVGEKE